MVALETRASSVGWARLASLVDDIITFKDGSYMSFREALKGTARGRQLDGLRGGSQLRVWVDDDLIERGAPEAWVHVTSAGEAIELLDRGRVVELSLDYDLGDEARSGRGIDVVDWLVEQQEAQGRVLWPRDGIILHTANPVGRAAMARAIEHYAAKHRRVNRTLTPTGKPRLTFS